MRLRTLAVAVAALTAGAIGFAPSAAADTVTTTPPLPWSLGLQTASASGTSHWTTVTRSDGYVLSHELTVDGTLTNTGSGCYRMEVAEFVFGFPSATHDAGKICGAGTIPVHYQGAAYNASLYLCAISPKGGCTVVAGPGRV